MEDSEAGEAAGGDEERDGSAPTYERDRGSEAQLDGAAEPVEEGVAATQEPGAADYGLAIAAVGTSSSLDEDPAVAAVTEELVGHGFTVVSKESLAATYDNVQSRLAALVDRRDVDLVVTVGGVGAGPGDVTVDAIEPLFDRRLPGVGELFRTLARERIDTRVVTDRSTAGVIQAVPVVCLPADGPLARLGASEILRPEAVRLVETANPDRDATDEDAEGAGEADEAVNADDAESGSADGA